MGLIITYDLSGQQTAVKNEMIQNKGYAKTFVMTKTIGGVRRNITVNLPETTLYHVSDSKTPTQAISDLENSAATHRVSVKRCISSKLIDGYWDAIGGVAL